MSIAAALRSYSPDERSLMSDEIGRERLTGRSNQDRLVVPGLIDIHFYPEHEPPLSRNSRGTRRTQMHMSGLYERSQTFSALDDEARLASAEFCSLQAAVEQRRLGCLQLSALGAAPRPSL